jgi:hypothetical protein
MSRALKIHQEAAKIQHSCACRSGTNIRLICAGVIDNNIGNGDYCILCGNQNGKT